MSKIISELKRRNVFRVAGGYAVVAWLLAQMASVLETSLNMPAWFVDPWDGCPLLFC